ncbi:MAG: hypothetical protein KJI69_02435 [Patescibacteria group bacterium]|nr:hypothetical protein [Patescibacteria group bacterium]
MQNLTSSGTEVLTEEQLKQLPKEEKLELGRQVSELIATHRETMLQYTVRQVEEIINDGRAIVVVDSSQTLCAFAQLSPWCDQNGKAKAIEFRSWISNRNGAGLLTLQGAIALNQKKYPSIPMYAVIEEKNIRAQQIVIRVGAKEVPMPDCMKVVLKAGDQPAPIRTYHII